MKRIQRIVICGAILASGLAAQAALERVGGTERPALRRPLSSLPMQLGDWLGEERSMPEDLVQRAQTTEYLSRSYESRKHAALKFQVWINYSEMGTNLRHTPEVCLPSGGATKVESQTRIFEIAAGGDRTLQISRLGYSQGELVQHIGFWYYIFGEGTLENYVRRLSITSQSSHGRATRGSSMTVEVFYLGDLDPNGEALREFARELIQALDPILPIPCAAYHTP